MNEDLTKKLKAKYPLIFSENFWFECDDGWYNLLDTTCYKIQAYIDDHSPKVSQITADQIKEKFGTLRFYFSGGDEFITDMILEAEKASAYICEVCGDPGTIIKNRSWIVCRCPLHTK